MAFELALSPFPHPYLHKSLEKHSPTITVESGVWKPLEGSNGMPSKPHSYRIVIN